MSGPEVDPVADQVADCVLERAITDGFVPMDGASMIQFAQMERQDNGAYQFKIGHLDSDACHFISGSPDLTLEQALDKMDEWERTLTDKPLHRLESADLGVQAQNFRVAARQLGIPVGPVQKSLHHAARAKRAAMSRRKTGVAP